MLSSVSRLCCLRCGAPQGSIITRKLSSPDVWTLDLRNYFNDTSAWRRPSKVVIRHDGFCYFCFKPSNSLPLPPLDLPREAASA